MNKDGAGFKEFTYTSVFVGLDQTQRGYTTKGVSRSVGNACEIKCVLTLSLELVGLQNVA